MGILFVSHYKLSSVKLVRNKSIKRSLNFFFSNLFSPLYSVLATKTPIYREAHPIYSVHVFCLLLDCRLKRITFSQRLRLHYLVWTPKVNSCFPLYMPEANKAESFPVCTGRSILTKCLLYNTLPLFRFCKHQLEESLEFKELHFSRDLEGAAEMDTY